MELKIFSCKTDAVSPVVGVILMIAITVLLVGIAFATLSGIADETPSQTEIDVQQSAFLFELNQNVSYATPNLDSSCPGDGSCLLPPNDDYLGDQVTVTYQGGKSLPAGDIRVRTFGAQMKYINQSNYLEDRGSGEYHSNYTLEDMSKTGTLTAGDSFTIVTNYGDYAKNPDPYNPGSMLRDVEYVRIIWEGGGSDQIIAEWNPT